MKNNLSDICNSFLDETMELNDLPGISIGVSFGNDCFTGARTGTGGSSLNENSVFHCASVSKLFTSTAIMKLVEAGSLSLYDRLSNILPGLSYAPAKSKDSNTAAFSSDSGIGDWRFDEIRLWNLLTHTSGLGDCDDYQWDSARTDENALKDYVYESYDSVRQPMLWAPQSSPEFYGPVTDENGNPANLFRYSNVAYEILGQIVAEYADGLSYEDFVMQKLLIPAGMSSSTMKTYERCDFNSSRERAAHNMADPFEKAPDRSIVPVEFYPYNRMHGPSSTLTSTPGDLLKWGRAHIAASRDDNMQEPAILQRETYDTVWRDYATVPNNGEKIGIGWFMRYQQVSDTEGNVNKYKLYGHEGSDDGFRSSFWICPQLDMVTVVLSNLSQAPVKKLNKKLFDLLAGGK